MRLRITFEPLESEKVTFPLNYNYGLESLIYRHISDKLATFLHDEGYSLGKRSFKLFTFSRLFGKFDVDFSKESISFSGAIHFYISSPENDFLAQFAESLMKSSKVDLFKQRLLLSSIEVHSIPLIGEEMLIRMLSPVTVYSTFFSLEGKKKTYYYSPFEDEFSRLIAENLAKKYQAFYKAAPQSTSLSITPVKVTKQSEKMVKYTPRKGPYTLVKGWMGIYELKGNPELIRIGYEAGIGSKNCQGFGMFEVMK